MKPVWERRGIVVGRKMTEGYEDRPGQMKKNVDVEALSQGV